MQINHQRRGGAKFPGKRDEDGGGNLQAPSSAAGSTWQGASCSQLWGGTAQFGPHPGTQQGRA